MSLFWQLRLTVLLITLVSFTGSLVISLFATQNHLEQQLHRNNIDIANSLAYSISHLNKDPATVDVQVSALFDSGQYESITVSALDGAVISERTQSPAEADAPAPAWFTRVYPISAPPGVGQISDAWMHFGVVTVASNTRFAHQVLWDQAESLLIWLLFGGLGCALVGMLMLLRANRPLAGMMEQAHAIIERSFLTISEPHIPELRTIARATNDLIRRLHNRAVEEGERMESVHRLVNYDPVTGLANREHFMNRFLEILGNGNAPAPGEAAEKKAPAGATESEDSTETASAERNPAPAGAMNTDAETGADSGAVGELEDEDEEEATEPGGSEITAGALRPGTPGSAAVRPVPDIISKTAGADAAGRDEPGKLQSGILFLIRVNDLKGINHTLGRTAANELLREISTVVGKVGHAAWSGEEGDPLAARLNGSDFALVVPGAEQASGPAQQLTTEFTELSRLYGDRISDLYHIGAVRYRRADMLGELLARADAALAAAERKGPNTWHAASDDADRAPPPALNIGDWRHIFDNALAEDRFSLARAPVINPAGDILHQEALVRMQAQPNGGWLDAHDFISIAARLQLTPRLDLAAFRHALDMLEKTADDLAIALSVESIADASTTNRMATLLRANPERSRRLWLEVSEYGAFQKPEAMKDFCHRFKALGCHVGIDHLARRIAEMEALASLGLDYVKVDPGLVHGINQSRRNQKPLKALCRAAHDGGMIVIASGVRTGAEQRALEKLGFDGLSGPGLAGTAREDDAGRRG